jgi:chemotaxis protein CheD
MSDTEQLPVVYLKPGELHFAKKPTVVVTVLGSCLSVTMFHRRGLGGICHGLLPRCNRPKDREVECLDGLKYVDSSIRQMVMAFDRYGVPRSEIEVKCFGGADMFTQKNADSGLVSIGKQNIITAEKTLASEGLTLRVKDVGGRQGRKILFYTHTGEVLLKRLSSNPDIISREIMQLDRPESGLKKKK